MKGPTVESVAAKLATLTGKSVEESEEALRDAMRKLVQPPANLSEWAQHIIAERDPRT